MTIHSHLCRTIVEEVLREDPEGRDPDTFEVGSWTVSRGWVETRTHRGPVPGTLQVQTQGSWSGVGHIRSQDTSDTLVHSRTVGPASLSLGLRRDSLGPGRLGSDPGQRVRSFTRPFPI